MKEKILIVLISITPILIKAQQFDIVADSNELHRHLSAVLRGVRFPGTIGSKTVTVDLQALHDRLLAWKGGLEEFLEGDTIEIEGNRLPLTDDQRATLVSRYFAFVSYLVQINKLVTGRSNWQTSANKFDLRVPPSLLWSQSPTMLALFKQMIVSEMQDGQAVLRLNVAFVDGLQAEVLANTATVDSHREVVKYSIYSRLYRQLVQNEHYRGQQDTHQVGLPPGFNDPNKHQEYELELRQAIIDHHRVDHQKLLMRASLIKSYPQLTITNQKLKMPLIDNWYLYEDFRAKHPELRQFTTARLAERIYPLLSKRQRENLATNNSRQFQQVMILVEHLLLGRELIKATQGLNIDLDGSGDSLRALHQSLIKAQMNALLAGLMQLLRIKDRQKLLTIVVAVQRREQQLLAGDHSIQLVSRWYDKARQGIDDLQTRSRQALIRELLFISWKVDRIETSANEPVNMQVLRRSLWRTFVIVSDFSGEFQQSLSAILRTNSYLAGKDAFFVELSKYLNRLGQQQLTVADLKGLTVDDLTNRYLEPALAQTTPVSNPLGDAVYRKVNINHLAQLKSFIQHGHWFGYFADDQKKIPTLDDLPLSEQQKENYFKELKFSYFDLYPFLLLKPDESSDRELYLMLADATKDQENLKTITDEDLEKFWPLIVASIDQQRDRIINAIAEIDRADSVQDIKHIVANSQTIKMALKEFAGLYPLHEKFIELYHKPSKFRHNWEKIDLEYIGGMFNIFIAHLVGGWLLRKTIVTSYPLRYLTPMFGSAVFPYMKALEWAWGVILVDFFVLKPAEAFIINPQKVNAVRDYYYLGNQQDQFFSRTQIDYLDMGKNAHLLNYAFEASMMGIFVGMYGVHFVQRKFFDNAPRLLPYLRERRFKKDLDRLGLTPKRYDAESPQNLAKNFSGKHFTEISSKKANDITILKHNAEKIKHNVRDVAEQRIREIKKKMAEEGFSKGYLNTQVRQIELARDRVIKTIDRKLRMWQSIEIEHHHDFRALGIEPTHRMKDFSLVVAMSEAQIKSGNVNFKDLERLNASANIQMNLMRLNNTLMTGEMSQDKINKEVDRVVRRFSKDDKYGKDLDFLGLPRNKLSSFDRASKLADDGVKGKSEAIERLTKASNKIELFRQRLSERGLPSYHELLVEALFYNKATASNSGGVTSSTVMGMDEAIATLNKYYEEFFGRKFNGTGLTKDSTQADIKNLYRRVAVKTHPDKTGGDKAAEEKFKKIYAAYEKALERGGK